MDIQNCLNSILTNKGHHQENENRVFKTCDGEWIAVMEKYEDTVTDESRSGVIDPRYATFTADKLKVLEIFNKFDCNKTIDELSYSKPTWFGREFNRYKVGEQMIPSFENNLHYAHSNGIDYFKTLEPAFYFTLTYVARSKSIFLNGTHRKWHKNGNLQHEENLRNNECHGPSKSWYENGDISCESNHEDGKFVGTLKHWYGDKKLFSEENYRDNKLHGPYREWHENGNIKSEGNYEDGDWVGIWRDWYDDNKPKNEENFKKGVRHGLCRYWFPNGDIEDEKNYIDGQLVYL